MGPCPVPYPLLFQGLLPQRRWNESESPCQVMMCDSGISATAASIFSDNERLCDVLKECIRRQLLVVEISTDGNTTYFVPREAQSSILDSFSTQELCVLGIVFTTYLFSRDEVLERSCV